MASVDWRRIRVALGLAVGLVLLPRIAFAVDLPDLVVTSVSSPPADAFPGDPLSLTVVVTNQGTAATEVPPQSDNATTFNLLPVPPGSNPKKNLKGIQIIKTPLAIGESDGANVPVTVAVYSDTLPGTYQLQACADGKEFVAESVEGNNCTIAAGTITIHQVPDLVASSVTIHQASAGQGDRITGLVTNTVTNSGPVAADASTTTYSLVSTTDGTTKDLKGPLDPTTGVLLVNPVPVLNPGAFIVETRTVAIRPDTAPGLYRVQACADGAKALPEVNNNNNCATSLGTIQVTARPDLVITSVTVPPSQPLTVHAGDPLVVSTVVKNQGLAVAGSSTLKLVLLNTTTAAEKNLKVTGTLVIPTLGIGASATILTTTNVTVYSDTLSGTYTVQACADPLKPGVAESVESNNCGEATATVTVVGLVVNNADLAVTAVTDLQCFPEACANAIPGTNISLTATIENLGTDPVSASTTNPLTIGFTLVRDLITKNLKKIDDSVTIIQPMAPGAIVILPMTVQVYSDTLPGTYALRACADGPKLFAESNENNNCAPLTGSIVVNPVPNLMVTSIQNPPSTAQLGGSFPILTQVKNIGPVATRVPTRTKFSLVSTAIPPARLDLKGPSTATVPVLNANAQFNETESLTIYTDTALGEYFLEACVDGNKDVTEGDESDNCKTSSGKILVNGLPDYVVTSIAVTNAPLQVKRGATVTVSATVKNQGIGNATKDSVLKFFLVSTAANGPTKNLNGTRSITKLDVGKSASVSNAILTVFLDTPLGTYTVQACADATNVLAESLTGPQGTAETNNCTSTTATVQVIP